MVRKRPISRPFWTNTCVERRPRESLLHFQGMLQKVDESGERSTWSIGNQYSVARHNKSGLSRGVASSGGRTVPQQHFGDCSVLVPRRCDHVMDGGSRNLFHGGLGGNSGGRCGYPICSSPR